MANKRTPDSASNQDRPAKQPQSSEIFLTEDKREYHRQHEILYRRVGGLCSHCQAQTSGGNENIGRPVVLKKRLPDGKRTAEYLDLIWLCKVCHEEAKKMNLSEKDLLEWKKEGEEKAYKRMHPNESQMLEAEIIAFASTPAILEIRKAKATLVPLFDGDCTPSNVAELVTSALDSLKWITFHDDMYSFQVAYEMLLLLECTLVKAASEDVIRDVLEKCIQAVKCFVHESSTMQAIANIVKRMFEAAKKEKLNDSLLKNFLKLIGERKHFTLQKEEHAELVIQLDSLANEIEKERARLSACHWEITPESTGQYSFAAQKNSFPIQQESAKPKSINSSPLQIRQESTKPDYTSECRSQQDSLESTGPVANSQLFTAHQSTNGDVEVDEYQMNMEDLKTCMSAFLCIYDDDYDEWQTEHSENYDNDSA